MTERGSIFFLKLALNCIFQAIKIRQTHLKYIPMGEIVSKFGHPGGFAPTFIKPHHLFDQKILLQSIANFLEALISGLSFLA